MRILSGPDLIDPDDDNDGMEDSIDTQPLVASSRFDDTPLGGKTSGRIVSLQSGVSVVISDEPPNTTDPNISKGVRVVVSGATTDNQANIKIDGSSGTHKLVNPGTYVLSDPETTVTTQVILGTAEIVFDTVTPPVVVVVEVGVTATITETFVNGTLQSFTVVAVTGVVTVNGEVLPNGGSLTVVADTEGPVTSNVEADPNPVALNNPEISLTTTVSDFDTGGSKIASAAFNIDGGTYTLMDPDDLAFDAVTENVLGSIAEGMTHFSWPRKSPSARAYLRGLVAVGEGDGFRRRLAGGRRGLVKWFRGGRPLGGVGQEAEDQAFGSGCLTAPRPLSLNLR